MSERRQTKTAVIVASAVKRIHLMTRIPETRLVVVYAMKFFIKVLFIGTILAQMPACNQVTYRLHSKKRIQHEKPSIVLLNAIIDYRIEQQHWPVTREDFTSMGKRYVDAFEGFPYNYIQFKITDLNTMTFYFSEHIFDVKKYDKTKKIDLNSFSGRVKFYQKDGQFLWKLRMN